MVLAHNSHSYKSPKWVITSARSPVQVGSGTCYSPLTYQCACFLHGHWAFETSLGDFFLSASGRDSPRSYAGYDLAGPICRAGRLGPIGKSVCV